MELTTLSSKGQIVIPEAVRKQFKLKFGERLVLFRRENELVLKREIDVEQILREERSELGGWNKLAETSFARVWDNKEDDAWNKFA